MFTLYILQGFLQLDIPLIIFIPQSQLMGICVQIMNPDPDQPMNMALSGEVADPGNLPAGCAFHPRCPHAEPGRCDRDVPPLDRTADNRTVACLRHAELGGA